MMISSDIRECNRLERNENRLAKVVEILDLVYRENNVSDLEIQLIRDKAERARRTILLVRKTMMSNSWESR